MPTVEVAWAVTLMVPVTVAPAAGEVMETVGGALATVTVMAAEVVLWPCVSVASAASVWLPFAAVPEDQDVE